MTLVEFINKYIKRGNFLADFVTISKKAGFDHRWSGKGTNESDKNNLSLTNTDLKEVCQAWDTMVETGKPIIDEVKAAIKE